MLTCGSESSSLTLEWSGARTLRYRFLATLLLRLQYNHITNCSDWYVQTLAESRTCTYIVSWLAECTREDVKGEMRPRLKKTGWTPAVYVLYTWPHQSVSMAISSTLTVISYPTRQSGAGQLSTFLVTWRARNTIHFENCTFDSEHYNRLPSSVTVKD